MPHHDPVPFDNFDFDLAKAVLLQLVETFDILPVGLLSPHNFQHMPGEQGVYQLYLSGELRYVGKSDNLPSRLSRHYRELSARQNIDLTQLGFKALYIHRNWTTWTTEAALIRHFQGMTNWNASGFGSNDPGHNRDNTAEDDTFNFQYPIRTDIPVTWIGPQTSTAWEVVTALKDKDNLPYLFRFHRVTDKFRRQIDKEAEQQLKETRVTIPQANMTVRELLIEIARQLGSGWQATQLMGRVILYKERVDYMHGTVLWRDDMPA